MRNKHDIVTEPDLGETDGTDGGDARFEDITAREAGMGVAAEGRWRWGVQVCLGILPTIG